MFPGATALSVRDVLRPEFAVILDRGHLPYSMTAETWQWFGSADPPEELDALDPLIWVEGESLEGIQVRGRFIADLEDRIPAGVAALEALRQRVEVSGLDGADLAAVRARAVREIEQRRERMNRAMPGSFDDAQFEPRVGAAVESILRDLALYRRLHLAM